MLFLSFGIIENFDTINLYLRIIIIIIIIFWRTRGISVKALRIATSVHRPKVNTWESCSDIDRDRSLTVSSACDESWVESTTAATGCSASVVGDGSRISLNFA